jgi:UDP-N-acetylglucosamine 2-epimerase (non-hydrolysing)
MKILVTFGTRPEWLKIKPLVAEFNKKFIDYSLLFTGQHTDLVKGIKVDYHIKQEQQCRNRLNSVISNCLQFETIEYDKYSHVLVQGDTSSALAMALWGFNHGKKIIHLEAGLRTDDLQSPFPEEANRQLISRLSEYNFCATDQNRTALLKEKCQGNNYVVGNTVLDNIVDVVPEYGNKVLVTLHRRENHDNIGEWFTEIDDLAKNNKDLEFILPLHPNPNVQKHKDILKYVKVVPPMAHDDLIELLRTTRFVITDSGGIQEEATFLQKKIIICRDTTEREECLGTHGVLCMKPSDLHKHSEEVINNYIVNSPCPFGDGHASEKITHLLKYLIAK